MRELIGTFESLGLEPKEWKEDGVCAQVGGDYWYPEKGESDVLRQAQKMCRRCPVRVLCLAEALELDDRHGVWGGITDRPRRPLAKRVAEGEDSFEVAIEFLEGYDERQYQFHLAARERLLTVAPEVAA